MNLAGRFSSVNVQKGFGNRYYAIIITACSSFPTEFTSVMLNPALFFYFTVPAERVGEFRAGRPVKETGHV